MAGCIYSHLMLAGSDCILCWSCAVHGWCTCSYIHTYVNTCYICIQFHCPRTSCQIIYVYMCYLFPTDYNWLLILALFCACVYIIICLSCCAFHFTAHLDLDWDGSGSLVLCVWGWLLLTKCIRSQFKWCYSLSKWMSVSSSHLNPSCPHTFSHSKPLSSEVPGTRWIPTDCHHNISGFLYTHWSCSCHNVHSQSGRTNPTWIWVCLLSTHSYNSQW